MPLTTPSIDNRTFDDIVAEVRTRIPRYTPEWTDLNDNDPGMALVQVFAWMTELLMYRLSKVPELNYIKFLQLIGVELRPAEPARAEVTFPVTSKHPERVVHVPARTKAAAETDEGEQLVFETDRSLVALRASLAALQAYDGFSYVPLTEQNEDLEGAFHPFGPLAQPDSALLIGFADDEPLPAQTELNLTFFAPEDASGVFYYACGVDQAPAFTQIQLRWEFFDGAEWQSMKLLKDETQALTRSGHVFLKTPPEGKMVKAKIGEIEDAHFWIRARLAGGSFDAAPSLLAVRTNTIGVTQAETIREEVLGGSDGSPNQTFQLADAPVLAGTLRLEVHEGEDFEPWTRVDDFFGSGPDDPHYVLNRTTGEIEFGDGENGRIPVANVKFPTSSVVAREYRVGGGAAGNVAAGSLSTLLSSVPGIDANEVRNERAAAGGEDEETVEAAIKRAPSTLKSRSRAVSNEDYEALAMEAGGVRRARALPLNHPDFPDVPVPGVVTVVIVPNVDTPKPTPSEALLRSVCAYLDERRLLTTEVYVTRPVYVRVEITGEIIAGSSADLGEVAEAVEQALLTYFHPLKGGEDGQGWPFGGDVYFSRVYQTIFTVPGVDRIEDLTIVIDGKKQPRLQDVAIPEGALVYSTEHSVSVRYAVES